jgi:Domain of unknown function (DUF4352)
MQTRAILVAVMIVAFVGCSASDREPQGGAGGAGGSAGSGQDAAAPTPIHTLAETAHATDYDMTITGVAEGGEDSGPCPIPYYFAPQAGNIKLGVEVKITATSQKQVPVNPVYAKLTDSAGYGYTSTFGGCSPELKSLTLAPGQTASGWITFEIPETSVGLVLTYSPFIASAEPNEVKFDLGR